MRDFPKTFCLSPQYFVGDYIPGKYPTLGSPDPLCSLGAPSQKKTAKVVPTSETPPSSQVGTPYWVTFFITFLDELYHFEHIFFPAQLNLLSKQINFICDTGNWRPSLPRDHTTLTAQITVGPLKWQPIIHVYKNKVSFWNYLLTTFNQISLFNFLPWKKLSQLGN